MRKQRILEVAGGVFSSRGYHGASMDEIAERAGITKPIVYAHFASKEQLYLAYIESAGRELLERMRTAAEPGLDPRERLHRGVHEFLGFVAERRAGWQVLYSEANARGGPLAEQIATLRRRIANMVARLLEQSLDAPAPPGAATLDGLTQAFVGAGESLANWWLEQPEVSVEHAAALLMTVADAARVTLGDRSKLLS